MDLHSLQVESPEVVVGAELVVGASEHKPSAAIQCAAVPTHHLQVLTAALQPHLLPLIRAETERVDVEGVVEGLAEGDGGAAVDVEYFLVGESLVFEPGFGSVDGGGHFVEQLPL